MKQKPFWSSPSVAFRLDDFSALNARMKRLNVIILQPNKRKHDSLYLWKRLTIFLWIGMCAKDDGRMSRIHWMHPSKYAQWRPQNKGCLLRILQIETALNGSQWRVRREMQPSVLRSTQILIKVTKQQTSRTRILEEEKATSVSMWCLRIP